MRVSGRGNYRYGRRVGVKGLDERVYEGREKSRCKWWEVSGERWIMREKVVCGERGSR